MTRYMRATTAAVLLLLLLLAIPAALVAAVGNPLPGWGDLYVGDVSDTAVLHVLVTFVWLGWASFARAVITELLAHLRHTPLPQRGSLRPNRRLARTLVTAVFLLVPAAGPALAAPLAPAGVSAPAHVTTNTADASMSNAVAGPAKQSRAGPTTADRAPAVSAHEAGQDVTDVVIGTDGPFTMWGLAEQYLGDGTAWTHVWALNQGRTQADGTVMSDPGWMKAGWSVSVPTPHLSPGPNSDPSTSTQPGGLRAGTDTPGDPEPNPKQVGELTAEDEDSSPMKVFGLGAGAGVLAGVSLSELIQRRHRQSRHRRPGRLPAATPPHTATTEKALLLYGPGGQDTAAALDHALRALARDLSRAGTPLPDISAVHLDADTITLLPGTHHAAGSPPPPWRTDPATRQWSAPRPVDVRPERHSRLRRTHFPPYPALATIGTTDTGQHWWLDLEATRVLTLTGDPHRGRALARHLIAELANQTWSEQLSVTLVGFPTELRALNTGRITCTHDLPAAIANLHTELLNRQRALSACAIPDVLHGRAQDTAADMWMPEILVIDPTALTANPDSSQTFTQLTALAAALSQSPGRTALALVLATDPPDRTSDHQDSNPNHMPGTRLHIDADGYTTVPGDTQKLMTAGISRALATSVADVLAAAETTDDRATPASPGHHPWDALSDTTGAPTPELTATTSDLTPGARQPPVVARGPLTVVAAGTGLSVLGHSPAAVPDRSATTARDIHALAPAVTDTARRQVADADPELDADLVAWRAPHTDRPRLSVLGPLLVRAHGSLPADRPREPWHTEVLTYLATHPGGVSSERLGTDLWPEDPEITSKPKVRRAVHLVRRWLGDDPTTGRPHIPHADSSEPGGLGQYRVEGLLTDADLVRRLRLRGTTRGPDGINDLEGALTLVTGPPFDRRRPGGYTWLADTPLDVEYTAMITDIAHVVATHHLIAGHPDLAAAAARVALTAGSHEDTPLLDLVAACDAQGLSSEANAWIRHILTTHDAEVEEDLPPRTADILHRRRWIPQVS